MYIVQPPHRPTSHLAFALVILGISAASMLDSTHEAPSTASTSVVCATVADTTPPAPTTTVTWGDVEFVEVPVVRTSAVDGRDPFTAPARAPGQPTPY